MKLKDSIIIILVFIIAIAIGVFAGVKFTEEKQGNNDINQDNDVNNETSWVSGDVTKDSVKNKDGYEEVKQLVDKYKDIGKEDDIHLCQTYISELSEETKLLISVLNTTVSEEIHYKDERLSDIVCILEDPSDNYYYDIAVCAGSLPTGEYVPVYSYEDVLATKKKLFGSQETISLDGNWLSDTVWRNRAIAYSNKTNLFFFEANGACIPRPQYAIEDFGYEKDSLNVIINITIYSETTRRYLYTFKQENNNYYLADITQLD